MQQKPQLVITYRHFAKELGILVHAYIADWKLLGIAYFQLHLASFNPQNGNDWYIPLGGLFIGGEQAILEDNVCGGSTSQTKNV